MHSLRSLAVLAFLAAIGCRASLDVPDAATISCNDDRDCPEPRTCQTVLHRCVGRGTVLQEQRVVFTTPGNGNGNVSTTADIVLAFSLAVDADALAPFISLGSDNGPVELVSAQPTGDPSVVVVHGA